MAHAFPADHAQPRSAFHLTALALGFTRCRILHLRDRGGCGGTQRHMIDRNELEDQMIKNLAALGLGNVDPDREAPALY